MKFLSKTENQVIVIVVITALIYHDYFAATILTFIWLFAFWWFAYGFVLEERESVQFHT